MNQIQSVTQPIVKTVKFGINILQHAFVAMGEFGMETHVHADKVHIIIMGNVLWFHVETINSFLVVHANVSLDTIVLITFVQLVH